MQPFTVLTGVAAPLPLANVDTDKIIPARFLKTIKRTGLGVHLFDTLRYDENGKERPEFVLNQGRSTTTAAIILRICAKNKINFTILLKTLDFYTKIKFPNCISNKKNQIILFISRERLRYLRKFNWFKGIVSRDF